MITLSYYSPLPGSAPFEVAVCQWGLWSFDFLLSVNHLLFKSLIQLNFFIKFAVGYTFVSLPYFPGNPLIHKTQIADYLLISFYYRMMGPFVIDFPNEPRQFVTDELRYFFSFFLSFPPNRSWEISRCCYNSFCEVSASDLKASLAILDFSMLGRNLSSQFIPLGKSLILSSKKISLLAPLLLFL